MWSFWKTQIFKVIKRQDCWNRCVPVFWCEAESELRSFGGQWSTYRSDDHLTCSMQCVFVDFLPIFRSKKYGWNGGVSAMKNAEVLLGSVTFSSDERMSFLETLQVHHQLSCLLIHSAALQAGRTSRCESPFQFHGDKMPKRGHAHLGKKDQNQCEYIDWFWWRCVLGLFFVNT